MKTVKRNERGEVTHIRIETNFFTKEDADKINFSEVNLYKFIKNNAVSKDALEKMFDEVLNERMTITAMRIIILKNLGEIK